MKRVIQYQGYDSAMNNSLSHIINGYWEKWLIQKHLRTFNKMNKELADMLTDMAKKTNLKLPDGWNKSKISVTPKITITKLQEMEIEY